MTPTLNELLDASLELPPEYRDGMSSHLPMALHALSALGAPDERLRSFHARYAERFGSSRAPTGGEALDDWRGALGRTDAFASLRTTFAVRLARDGQDATLRALLPALWPGAAGAAFHGLIRTAHAVQSGHAGELASALAYWAARWQAVPEGRAGQPLAFEVWAERLEAAATTSRPTGASIAARIRAAVESPAYAELAERAAIDELRPLSELAAALYARSGNFTVLHLVTATRAARVLLPWATSPAAVRAGFARAFAAALLSSRYEAGPASAPPIDWDRARAAAIASDDDHVVKVVHALIEERAAYGEGRRLAAAARALA